MIDKNTMTTAVDNVKSLQRSDRMNTKTKTIFSFPGAKLVIAIVITVSLLAVFPNVSINLNQDFTGQSKPAVGRGFKQEFTSLPEYDYIKAHEFKANVLSGVSGFRALPEYGYILMHSAGSSQIPLLPTEMQKLVEFEYIQTHNQFQMSVNDLPEVSWLPEGLQSLPSYGYIAVHNRQDAETFVAGLPKGLKTLPEAGYIQMHKDR